MPKADRQEMSVLWLAVSKAALKSKGVRMLSESLSADRRRSMTTCRRAVSEL